MVDTPLGLCADMSVSACVVSVSTKESEGKLRSKCEVEERGEAEMRWGRVEAMAGAVSTVCITKTQRIVAHGRQRLAMHT